MKFWRFYQYSFFWYPRLFRHLFTQVDIRIAFRSKHRFKNLNGAGAEVCSVSAATPPAWVLVTQVEFCGRAWSWKNAPKERVEV